MNDLIKREDVIATIGVMYERCDTYYITDYRDLMLESVKALPSAVIGETVSELAEAVGISKRTLITRLNNGWSVEDAVNKPVAARMKGADDEY